MAIHDSDQHERVVPIQLTGWEFDEIILTLEHAIGRIEDYQYRRNVQDLVVELARQLETYMEGEA